QGDRTGDHASPRSEDRGGGVAGAGIRDARYRDVEAPGIRASPNARLVTGTIMARIGVLALQGDFEAHAKVLAGLGCDVVPVRRVAHVDDLDGLVMPGGE